MITIYTFPECPFCQDLKERLVKEGIEYNEINVNLPENSEEFAKVVAVSNSQEVPIIKIGKQLLIPNVSFQSIAEGVELTKKFLG